MSDPQTRLSSVTDDRYTARGKTVDQILKDFEDHAMDTTYRGNTTDYLHAAVTSAAARAQERWAKVSAIAACTSALVAVAAVLVAVLR